MSRDRTVGDTFFLAFTTRAFATGIPGTLGGTPVVSAYEDAGLTQITAGITLGVDHDSVTGLNMLTLVVTGANGYETGKDYNLVITTGTVDSVSVVGEVVGQFSLGLSAAATDLANGTDGLGAIKTDTAAIKVTTDKFVFTVANQVDSNVLAISGDATAADNLELDYDGTGFAKTNSTVGTVTTLTGHTVQTGDSFARLAAPAGASVSADIAAVKVDTAAVKVTTDKFVFTVANQVDANSIAISGSTEAADNLEASAETIVIGTAQTGTLSTTVMTTDITEATDDHFNGRIIIWTSGVLQDQATDITDYSGTNGTFTYTAVTEAPSNGDTFNIV